MNESTSVEGALLPPPVENLLVSIGKVLSMASLYGSTHKLTLRARDDCLHQWTGLMNLRERIHLALADNELTVDGAPIESNNPFIRLLTDRLIAHEVTGFVLLRGLRKEECVALLDLLSAPPGGEKDFAEALAKQGLHHIQSERFAYRRVTDKEIVISVEEMARRKGKDSDQEAVADFLAKMRGVDAAGAPAAQAAAEEFIGKLAGGRADGGPGTQVEEITAFLKGEAAGDPAAVSEAVRKMASDTEQLASLITEAAVVRQRNRQWAEGESLADFVVACLRRTYDALTHPREKRTPQERDQTRKKLMVLEKSVLDRLHQMMDRYEAESAGAMDEALGRMHDEIALKEAAADYVRRRNALQKAEQTIWSQVRSRDLSAAPGSPVPESLRQAGMTPEGWRELVSRRAARETPLSGAAPAAGALPDGMTILAALLSELDTLMSSGASDRQAAGGLMGRIGEEVGKLADTTKSKIAAFDAYLLEPEDPAKKGGNARDESTAEALAEIVQELCQPASAIHCSVSMLEQGYLGPLNREQEDLVRIAVQCGLQLSELLHLLREKVGVPKTFEPVPQREATPMKDGAP